MSKHAKRLRRSPKHVAYRLAAMFFAKRAAKADSAAAQTAWNKVGTIDQRQCPVEAGRISGNEVAERR